MPNNENYSGQTIGNYEVLERLGSGKFGSVYRAQNKYVSERIVAIKIINDKYISSPQECAHFLNEARVLQKLEHPHILPIFDIGAHYGVPYMIIEYATEGSLNDYLTNYAGERLPLGEAITIIKQVGEALHHAHNKQVVHRDLKPDNILFKKRGEALLADFGIAAEMSTSSLRQTEHVLGTPPYMAPEQFRGIYGKLSDQYALGCIAYELVTGKRPFTIDHPEDTMEWALKHTREQPAPPSELNPAIPVDVEQAILKAMSKDLVRRFADMGAFLSAFTAASQAVLKTEHEQTVLNSSELTIGRAADNKWALNDKQISNHHAVIRQQGHGYTITDLGSTNGTRVNGQKLQPYQPYFLNEGDTVRMGYVSFEYTSRLKKATLDQTEHSLVKSPPPATSPSRPDPRSKQPAAVAAPLAADSTAFSEQKTPAKPAVAPLASDSAVFLKQNVSLAPSPHVQEAGATPTPTPEASALPDKGATAAPEASGSEPASQPKQTAPPVPPTPRKVEPMILDFSPDRSHEPQPSRPLVLPQKRRWLLALVSILLAVCLTGGAVAAYSIYHANSQNQGAPGGQPGTPATTAPTSTATPVSATSFPAQPVANQKWDFTYNTNYSSTQPYNGHALSDPINSHFIVVRVTIVNTSHAPQIAYGNLLALKDSAGNIYDPDPSSQPDTAYHVLPGYQENLEVSFIVPYTSCTFDLWFYDTAAWQNTSQALQVPQSYCRSSS